MSESKIKSVAVYCGHAFGNDPQYERDAKKLGELIAKNKLRLVFGAGDVGLMGVVSQSALNNGGEVIGISTDHVIAQQEPVREGVNVKIVEGLAVRKQTMFDLSDAFIILPGGVGTLDEVTDIMTKQQVGETKKVIYFLNTNKFWDIMGQMLVHMEQNGFIDRKQVLSIKVADTPEDIIKELTNTNNFITTGSTTNN